MRIAGIFVGLVVSCLASTATAGTLDLSTRLVFPVLVTEVPEGFLLLPNNDIKPLETGRLSLSFNASDLVVVDAPAGVSARYVLPSTVDEFGVSILKLDIELATAGGSLNFGSNVESISDLFLPTFDIITGPVNQFRFSSLDLDGDADLLAFDPFGSALTFGDLSNPVSAFSGLPMDLLGLAGTFELLDQAGESLNGLLLPRDAGAAQPVPEPASVALLIVTALVGGVTLRRRRSQ